MSAELRRLAEAAALGHWEADLERSRVQDGDGYTLATTPDPDDAAYIAAADPQTILALLDRLARVEAMAERDAKWRAEHALMSDCGCSYKDCYECGKGCRCVHTPYADLRAALAPAEGANGRQAGSDERVEAYDGAAADRRNLHDPDSGRIDNWSER